MSKAISYEAFAVEAGAFFEGNCRHSDNPLCDDKPGDDKTGEDDASDAQKRPASLQRPPGVGRLAPLEAI